MKKILITGNSGYIGSHLCQLLQKKHDYEIYGLDKKLPLVTVQHHFSENIVDILNDWKIPDIEFDCVIHLAAEISVSESVKDPELYYTTNVMGTLNVLKKIKMKRFVNASTGAAELLQSPYGISKKAAEEIVHQFCNKHDIPYTTFRFYNVTGSDGFNPTNPDGLMWNLMNARITKTFNLFGIDYNTPDGTAIRDYVHVNEICNALIQTVETSTNQIENLGHGTGTSVKEMVNLFKKVNNCDFEVIDSPRREGDIEKSVLGNPSKFMQKLYTMEDLLKI
jgi:UDP-glucose 4-epimerase